VAALDQVHAEGFDEGRLADTRHAGYAYAHRTSGVRQGGFQQLLRGLAILGTGRFHQRDRLRQGAAVPRAQTGREV
jgi:hypothetical protein